MFCYKLTSTSHTCHKSTSLTETNYKQSECGRNERASLAGFHVPVLYGRLYNTSTSNLDCNCGEKKVWVMMWEMHNYRIVQQKRQCTV